MSVLLVPLERGATEAIARRLAAQGDQVRVIESAFPAAARWRELGVFVAPGSGRDEDLVERAAQNVRSIVVIGGKVDEGDLAPILAGGRAARVPRVIVCCTSVAPSVLASLRSAGVEFVVLVARRSVLGARRVTDEVVAAGVDAADDLDGAPKLVIRLDEPAERGLLGLD